MLQRQCDSDPGATYIYYLGETDIYYYLGGTDIYYYQYILLLFIFYLVTPVQMKNLLMVRHHPHHHHHPCPDCLRGVKPTTMKRLLHPVDLFHNVLQNHLLDLQHRTSENPDPAGCTIGSLTRVIPFPRVTNHKTVPLFIILIKVFLRCKILSLETILSAHTHICMHACMHAYTHTHTHGGTRTHSHSDYTRQQMVGGLEWIKTDRTENMAGLKFWENNFVPPTSPCNFFLSVFFFFQLFFSFFKM